MGSTMADMTAEQLQREMEIYRFERQIRDMYNTHVVGVLMDCGVEGLKDLYRIIIYYIKHPESNAIITINPSSRYHYAFSIEGDRIVVTFEDTRYRRKESFKFYTKYLRCIAKAIATILYKDGKVSYKLESIEDQLVKDALKLAFN